MNENDKLLELVYLFADGEASESERSVLFSAMNNNQFLQNELQAAISINQSVNEELAEATLPSSIEKSLMVKAGFDNSNKVIENKKVSPKLKDEKRTNNFLYKIFVPFISAITGALIVYLLMVFETDNLNNSLIITVPSNQDFVNKEKILKNTIYTKENTLIDKGLNKAKYPIYPNKNQSIGLIKDQNISNKCIEKYNDISEITQSEYALKSRYEISNTKYKESLNTIEFNDNNSSTKYLNDINNKFSIQLSGLSGLAHFPNREVNKGIQEDFNNTSIEIAYILNDNLSFGLSAGQETFPIYIEENSDLNYNTSINWYGINARYSGDHILLKSIRPFYQLFAGYTISGPLFKVNTGLIWQIDSRTKFLFGLDASTLIYQYHNKYGTGEKIGLKYGIEVDF